MTSRRRGNRRSCHAQGAKSAEPVENLEILHETPIAKAARAKENVLSDEQRLVAEKDVEHARSEVHPRRDHPGDRAAFIEREPERAANDARISQHAGDLVAGVDRQSRVGVQEQQDVAAGEARCVVERRPSRAGRSQDRCLSGRYRSRPVRAAAVDDDHLVSGEDVGEMPQNGPDDRLFVERRNQDGKVQASLRTSSRLYKTKATSTNRAQNIVAFHVRSFVEGLAGMVDRIGHMGDNGHRYASRSRERE